MTVSDGIWYCALIITETISIPFRVGYDIIDRTNKTYKKYKPDRPFTGYTH
uniref:Uncharacterized protein n=1 Tax=viral metagenome TaxID=1070528 RepID=A0A6C0LCE2_9ZZZZ